MAIRSSFGLEREYLEARSSLIVSSSASAFLPSLPLMSGESFLDQLLLSRARQASE
jgi:hypothetical protein